MASSPGRARCCGSVALALLPVDATPATAVRVATPERALVTPSGSACGNTLRQPIATLGETKERAGDATAATAVMLTTPARALEAAARRGCCNIARSTNATSCGADTRVALCCPTACCCGEEDESSTEPAKAARSGVEDPALAINVGATRWERDREYMMQT